LCMTLNCSGNLIELHAPKVMGILNITPDSFYDGGKYKQETDILLQTETMLKDGATFIDLGGYSSRPGADHVPQEEELRRIVPMVELLLKNFPDAVLSIDTFRSTVAQECLDRGAALINDISAGQLDDAMMATVARYQVPYIIMHMRGTPQRMQEHTQYRDLLQDILYYFSEKIAAAVALGIKDIILDPGFGFAKTTEQNYLLLKKLALLNSTERPILVGLSRKSMIYKVLGGTPEKALNGTTALHMMALAHGAHILRAHDVKEAVECITLFNQLGPNVP
jgi:dihydropteroate synthase